MKDINIIGMLIIMKTIINMVNSNTIDLIAFFEYKIAK